MEHEEIFAEPFVEDQETGAGTGDHRENDPACAGFTPAEDKFWRSHFQHANQLANSSYEHVRPAYELGSAAARDERYLGQSFDQVESDLEGGWLNIRTGGTEWQAVRDYARQAFEATRRTGFIDRAAELGGTQSHDRATYSDPLADGIDPTSPASQEQTLEWQKADEAPAPWGIGDQGGFGDKSPTDRNSEAPNDRPAE